MAARLSEREWSTLMTRLGCQVLSRTWGCSIWVPWVPDRPRGESALVRPTLLLGLVHVGKSLSSHHESIDSMLHGVSTKTGIY